MDTYGTQLRERRLRSGLTQRQLAERAGTSQPTIAAIEAGTRRPTAATRVRLDAALRVRPSVLLRHARGQIRAVLAEHGVTNPRVFGSVSRGEDTPDSDLDLLVSTPEDFDIFDKAALVADLEEALGTHVDLVPDTARGPVGARARAEAVPL